MSKSVGVLTGGGDCPGLNAVIRAVTRRAHQRGNEVVGVREGWRGLVEGRYMELDSRAISGILPRGGTILGTTRTNPYQTDAGVERVLENFRAQSLDALVAIGGEDIRGVEDRTFREVEAWDPVSGDWSSWTPLPAGRHGISVGSVGSTILVIGGGTQAGLSASDTVEALDLTGAPGCGGTVSAP